MSTNEQYKEPSKHIVSIGNHEKDMKTLVADKTKKKIISRHVVGHGGRHRLYNRGRQGSRQDG